MWTAILDPPRQQRAWQLIDDIARCLAELGSEPGSGNEHPLLASGSSGLALFWAYLDAVRPGTDAGERALQALEASIENLARMDLIPSLWSGFCGVGWAVEHLTQHFFSTEEDLAAELDAELGRMLDGVTKVQPYELVGGLAGVGTYLLSRLARPEARRLLSVILDQLEASAEESAAGCTWRTRPEWLAPHRRARDPEGHYNLGVAHGVPGVLGFLAQAARAGFEDPRLERLAEGTVRWLRGKRLPPQEVSVYPATVALDGTAEPTRTAWCYGDLGVAAVLSAAGRSFNHRDWEREGRELALLAAQRPLAATGVIDAGLCHGAAGLAHLFNRFYQATGEAEFSHAAHRGLELISELRRPGEGYAGFVTWNAAEGEEGFWRGEAGLLTGIAGVGLALLAAVSDLEPAWDRVLLLAPTEGVA